jgi:hypothetical protein
MSLKVIFCLKTKQVQEQISISACVWLAIEPFTASHEPMRAHLRAYVSNSVPRFIIIYEKSDDLMSRWMLIISS